MKKGEKLPQGAVSLPEEEVPPPQASAQAEPVTEDLFREVYHFVRKRRPTRGQRLKAALRCSGQTVLNTVPVLSWLPKYNLKEYLLGDIIAGLTVAVMHIPHGLAYAPLGFMPPVSGLYMAVFPVAVYCLMGTSRHISIGTFAVVCMMAGQTVAKYLASQAEGNSTAAGYDGPTIAIALTFTVGLWQVALGLLRLGCLAVLLSSSLVSGFTAGAAVFVASVQLKNILGIEVETHQGPLKLIYFYIDLFTNIKSTNLVALGTSVCCLVILLGFNDFIKPWMQRKFPRCKIPVPIELMVIISGILVSYYLHLNKDYGVKVVGTVPQGMPQPTVPPLELIPKLLVDGLVIAIVATSISLSLAAIFATKSKYTVSANQELLAYGCSNLFGAFFQCLPQAASLSRSLVQHSVGGRTQLASIVSLILIVFILLFIGPVFEPVPYCVLSSIVLATLKGLIMQIKDLPKIWRNSSLDGFVWIVTFLSVIVLDLDYGLLIGITASIGTMILRTQTPPISVLGQVPNTNLFLNMDHYPNAKPIPNITILQIHGGLHFANADLVQRKLLNHTSKLSAVSLEKSSSFLVLSMASVSYIDPTSIAMLLTLYKHLKHESCDMYLTDVPIHVYDDLINCNFFVEFPPKQVLATVYDASEYLKQENS